MITEVSEFTLDTRETSFEAKIGEDLLLVEVARRLGAMKRRLADISSPHPYSVLGRIDQLTTPFKVSELVHMYLAVSVDNMWMLHRYVRKTSEIPMVAAYSLIRSVVEATSYGIWILRGDGNAIKAQRLLRIHLSDFQQHAKLQRLFGSTEINVADIEERIRALNSKLKGLKTEAIDDEIQTTAIVIAADREVNHRYFFNGVKVWRSTSGLSHASSPAISLLLERSPDGTRTSRMTLVAGFAVAAIENMEFLLDKFSSGSVDPSFARRAVTD